MINWKAREILTEPPRGAGRVAQTGGVKRRHAAWTLRRHAAWTSLAAWTLRQHAAWTNLRDRGDQPLLQTGTRNTRNANSIFRSSQSSHYPIPSAEWLTVGNLYLQRTPQQSYTATSFPSLRSPQLATSYPHYSVQQLPFHRSDSHHSGNPSTGSFGGCVCDLVTDYSAYASFRRQWAGLFQCFSC